MKLKTLLLALFCVFCMSGTALAESIFFTAADLSEYDWRAQWERDYGIYITAEGPIAYQSGFGDQYPSSDPLFWEDANKYKGFSPSSGTGTLHFENISVEGIILENLSIQKSAGTWTFTHSSGGTSIIEVDAHAAGSDFVTLYGDLIDYSLGGIIALTYAPGAWPNNSFNFFSMGYSAYAASAVPLPGAIWIMGTGLAGLAACRRKNAR